MQQLVKKENGFRLGPHNSVFCFVFFKKMGFYVSLVPDVTLKGKISGGGEHKR